MAAAVEVNYQAWLIADGASSFSVRIEYLEQF